MPARTRPQLGQHFLRDESFCHRIAQAVPVRPDDLLVEIGPGHGGVTRLLAPRVERLVAIELDPALARNLREEFRDVHRVEIIQGDVLKTDLAEICRRYNAEQCVVFGNLPYYITSPILRALFQARACVRHITVLVQREVAERITAAPGSRDYGYLSVLAQFHSQPRIAFEIPPGAFSPPPKVYSSLVDFPLRPLIPGRDEEACAAFLAFVRRCFAQKRKNLLNNLAATHPRHEIERVLQGVNLDLRARAEQISLEQFVALFERL